MSFWTEPCLSITIEHTDDHDEEKEQLKLENQKLKDMIGFMGLRKKVEKKVDVDYRLLR